MFIAVLMVFIKQKTAYEMRISDWSSDVCSSDLRSPPTSASRPAHVTWSRSPLPHEMLRPHLHQRPLARLPPQRPHRALDLLRQIGRASCRDRVCQYV